MLMKTALRAISFSLGVVFFIPTLYANPIVKKDAVMVEPLFSKTKPQCAGIYVVDVPESFNNGTHKAKYDDFDIESQFIYPPAFKQRIALREEALRNQKTSQKNAPALKEVIQLPDNQGVIFDKNQSGTDDSYRTLEAHVYINHIAFIITIDILDLSAPKYAKDRDDYLSYGFAEFKLNDKPSKLASMRSLISRLSGRLDHDIPTDKGWCIPNGFIADDGGQHKIEVGFSYENDDLLFGINANNTMIDNSDTLFGRSDAINDALKASSMKTLKKYASMVNGIPFEAWLFDGTQNYEQKTRQVYDFILYANESVASTSKLLATIGLNSKRKQTRYSEAQMVEIWDRIIGSLRYKPNAF
ncbi:T6SS immunity protein Tli4 family protein [Providencia stuartii]|uniref:T6SS immunity protein Tli4 family protein n=1 Tax=Providencia stuartii TaxID=588 RepID=UPI0023E25003|nr:T6SS immunity protein Tli4 family protein [Providencia stuartii]WER23230.1 T6SS immunity protein Tli4 family protein [Providencia stuartii]WER27350.1 T6SS immunity protein Tli4 family protein [Providencia stuartii]WER31441.1 T6SS immunity protein Tli4 family protein [Providencia stuartii]